jgi:hemoglobin
MDNTPTQATHTSQSLYERLGGKEAVQAAVTKFYSRLLNDPLLSPFFDPDRIDILKRSQMAFMTMAFGGPHTYTGKHLREAHAPLLKKGLADKHFDMVAWHLSEVLRELGVDEKLIEETLAVVETTRKDVLSK